jgi:dethiobiotin synthetase
MSVRIFITGTDTGIGKTYVTTSLLHALSQRGFATIGIKPLATGGFWQNGQMCNEDALALANNASIKLAYAQINPVIFTPPIAPHLAAQEQGKVLSANSLMDACAEAFNYPADVCFVEGVGGWLTPLNERETMADFVRISGCKVILVVGMRLGCLNHTLLTYDMITQMQIPLLGWIANCLDPNMLYLAENIATLQQRLAIPYLGTVPYASNSRLRR